MRSRLSDKPLTLQLKSGGTTYANSVLRGYTFGDVDIDAAGKPLSIPWDGLSPASIAACTGILFERDRADKQFECGRFFISRRMWKEAAEALQRAVQLDPDEYEDTVTEIMEVLQKVLKGDAGFRGRLRMTSETAVDLTYDFADPAQPADFGTALKCADGGAVLEGAGKVWAIHPAVFIDECEVETRVATDVPLDIYLFSSAGGSHRVRLGFDAVSLTQLTHRADRKSKETELFRQASVPILKGRAHDVRLSARQGRFRLFIDRQEALDFHAPASPGEAGRLAGTVAFSLDGGKCVLSAPLAIRGEMDPRDIDKRLGEVEVLVRRSVNPDLEDVEESRRRDRASLVLGTAEGIRLTADDALFALRLQKDLYKYDELKTDFAAADGAPLMRRRIDDLIAAHPDVPSLYYLRALHGMRQQKWPEVRRDIAKALAIFPDFAEAHALQARVAFEDDDYQAALTGAQRAIDLLPDSAPAYVVRARAAYALDPASLDRCVADLRLVTQISASNAEAPALLRTLRYQARGPRDLGCVHAFESAHYVVMTDISPEAAKLYAERLEAAFEHFVECHKSIYTAARRIRKPRVAIFNTRENYHTYQELIGENRLEHTLGVYRDAYKELVLFEDLDRDETLHTLYHEAFHHFSSLIGGAHTPPFWYNEGIAEYRGAIRVDGGKVVERALILRERLGSFQQMLRWGLRPMPFKTIMTETPVEFYSWTGFMHPSWKYGQAWSMIHFFHEYQGGKYRPLIARYFEEVRKGAWLTESYDAVFKDDAAAIQAEWLEYVKQLKP